MSENPGSDLQLPRPEEADSAQKLFAGGVPVPAQSQNRRIGVAAGRFKCPDDFDALNDEILALFGLKPQSP